MLAKIVLTGLVNRVAWRENSYEGGLQSSYETYQIPKEQREQLIGLVQEYFETERGETLSHLAAEGVLDFSRRP